MRVTEISSAYTILKKVRIETFRNSEAEFEEDFQERKESKRTFSKSIRDEHKRRKRDATTVALPPRTNTIHGPRTLHSLCNWVASEIYAPWRYPISFNDARLTGNGWRETRRFLRLVLRAAHRIWISWLHFGLKHRDNKINERNPVTVHVENS